VILFIIKRSIVYYCFEILFYITCTFQTIHIAYKFDTAIFILPLVVMYFVKSPADGVLSYFLKHPINYLNSHNTSCIFTFIL